MSELLHELVERRKAEEIDYAEYLKQIEALAKQVRRTGESTDYPAGINTRAKQAIYDNVDRDESRAIAIDTAVCVTKKDGWRDSKPKIRQVRGAIRKVLPDDWNDARIDELLNIIKNQSEY